MSSEIIIWKQTVTDSLALQQKNIQTVWKKTDAALSIKQRKAGEIVQ
jgi:hypothetical protein